MWDALETLHDETNDDKQFKINTLIQQYELSHMEDGESISSMQMRFTHIITCVRFSTLTNFIISWNKKLIQQLRNTTHSDN